ncbi:MAG: LysE family transporter [Neisseriaceae bacterium]|nr:LysE family transporter [Neisseriaceae bacterium]MBP6862578.1 LysE family transporter [Neisseriaceae bacterium]
MNEMAAVIGITLLAVISPGADFAMVTRNSYVYGRARGLWTALGIATGVWVHVAYTVLGVSLLLVQAPWLLQGVKMVGVAYLLFLGWQTFTQRPVREQGQDQGLALEYTAWQAWRVGFLTNALNPKTTLFVLSLFTQIVGVDTALWRQMGYGLFLSLAHGLWFALVALLLSQPHLRQRLLQRQVGVNRFLGVLLGLLGLLLLGFSIGGGH